MQIEQTKLKNGLNTLFVDQPGAQAGTVQIWFRAGSALEQKENQGIAHFLEHMFFKGTKKRPGAKIAHDVESFGGEINAFTSFDYTCYYINSPSEKLSTTVDILMDMVSGPVFKMNDLVPEREVVFEEYRRSQDNSSQFNFQQIQKTGFKGGYAHPILGTPKTIKNFSQKQLREFRKNYYNLNNSMLVVAGDLKQRKKISSIIEKYKLPKGKTSDFPVFNLKNKSSVSVHQKDVRQSTLTFTIQAPKFLEDKSAAEDLAVNCLAYGELSPLYKKLVTDTSLASSVSGSTMFFNKGGIHFIRFTFPEKNFEKVLAEAKKVLTELKEVRFDDISVNRIKNQYVASKIYEKESIESYAFNLGHGFAQNGDINCDKQFIDQINKCSVGQVNNAFTDILSRQFHATLQVPRSEEITNQKEVIDSFIKELNSLFKGKKATKNKTLKSNFDPAVRQIKLKEGVELVYRYNPMTPTFVFHSYIKGGQTQETEETQGLFQLLQKSITYGYHGVPYHELKTDLELKSAYINGFSGKNAYGLTMHGLTTDFNHLLKHYFGILTKPELPDPFVNLEKELIIRTLENQKEDPVKQCFSRFNEIIFEGHPYARNILGTEENVQSYNSETLKKTHLEKMNTEQLVFTYCGDLEESVVVETIQSFIEDLPDRKPISRKTKSYKSAKNENHFIELPREQTQIFIGKKAYKVGETEDLYLKLFTQHLSGQSSELFVDVRDRKGLCYAVQPVQHTSVEGGFWGIYIGAGHDKKELAVEAITDILNKYQKNGFTKKEFERAKVMIEGQNQLNIQTNDDYAGFYSIPVLHNLGLNYPHLAHEKIKKFKLESFNRFLKSFLKTDWNKIEVGPKS
jgi:zinc protease